jgi:hypothetical protein
MAMHLDTAREANRVASNDADRAGRRTRGLWRSVVDWARASDEPQRRDRLASADDIDRRATALRR